MIRVGSFYTIISSSNLIEMEQLAELVKLGIEARRERKKREDQARSLIDSLDLEELDLDDDELGD